MCKNIPLPQTSFAGGKKLDESSKLLRNTFFAMSIEVTVVRRQSRLFSSLVMRARLFLHICHCNGGC